MVGGIPTPLKNMRLSVGMIIPNIWKNMFHVPNHSVNVFIYPSPIVHQTLRRTLRYLEDHPR